MNIFVDGSYSPQKQIGVGAYIIIDSVSLNSLTDKTIADLKIDLSSDVVYHIFKEAKGSTDVEQKILEIALEANKNINKVYTDCQRTRTNDKYTVVHVKGHTKQVNRNDIINKVFDVIDKAARKRLRQLVN